jgi:peptidoglycan glycosyltransferase
VRASRSAELGLLFLVWIVIAAFYALASLGVHGHLPTHLDLVVVFVVLVSLFVHLGLRRLAPYSSQVLFPIATLLNGIGYVEIARYSPHEATLQAVWVTLSAGIVIGALAIVRRVSDLDRYRYLLLLAALLLIMTPFTPHFGENLGGARLWVAVGPFSFQPVEIAKILLAFFFASYLAANRDLLSTPTQRFLGRLVVPPRIVVPIFVVWGVALMILAAENNIGFAMMLFILFFALLWVTTGLKSYVLLGLALFAGGGVVAYQLFYQVHQRISVWLDPWYFLTHQGTYQIAYAWFALANGGVTGTGLGLGTIGAQVGLATSDTIFAALGEELGFVGIVVIVSLFALFVAEGFRIGQRAHSDFTRLVATALTATLGLQAFFIMAGILRVLPFTGITLPFMAYGGSSLFSNYLIVAILLRISDENARELRGGEVVALDMTSVVTERTRRRGPRLRRLDAAEPLG